MKDYYHRKTKPQKKKATKHQVNMIEDDARLFFRLESKHPLVYFVHSSYDWWLNLEANVYVYFDRSWFSTFQELSGKGVILGSDSAAQVLESDRVDLKMTYRKKNLIFYEVLYISNIKRNLISRSLLISRGYKIILESNKLIIIRNNEFIEKDFVSEGLFKLSVILKNSNKDYSLILNLESSNIWYGRLGHINFDQIQYMTNLNLIPKIFFWMKRSSMKSMFKPKVLENLSNLFIEFLTSSIQFLVSYVTTKIPI